MTWGEWINLHAVTFGFGLWKETAPQEMGMLASWSRMFGNEGYTPEDVAEATRTMERRPSSPDKREGHRVALLEILQARRAAQLCASATQSRLGGGDVGLPFCGDCEGCGMVSVPYPLESVQGRRGVEYGYLATLVVACRCHAGKVKRPERMDGTPLMTFDQYLIYVPDWREIMAGWRESVRLRASAQLEATELDRQVGKLVRQTKEKTT